MELSAALSTVKYVGPRMAELFKKKGIRTIEDALRFFPRDYEDRSRLTPIAELKPGQVVTVMGQSQGGRGSKIRGALRFEAKVEDSTGVLRVFWFRANPSIPTAFEKGNEVLVHGEVSFLQGAARMAHPDFERVVRGPDGRPQRSVHFGRIVPVYSETEGLGQKNIRRIMAEVLKQSWPHLDDPLPPWVLERLKLPTLRESLVRLHFPKSLPQEIDTPALRRVSFEDCFALQWGLIQKREARKRVLAPKLVNGAGEQQAIDPFIKSLPFQLTRDQLTAIDTVLVDLSKHHAMSRLIQGDVGSGKTVVAFAACLVAVKSGKQAAILAPTEVLAQQHARTAEQWLSPLGVRVALMTQSTLKQTTVRQMAEEGSAQLIIGTHALFQKHAAFNDLALVVVDEQHRFGVEQRGELLRKAGSQGAHLLMMTATPIPRTLALTVYGDLDLTMIRQKPANRKPVSTLLRSDRDRPAVYSTMRQTMDAGQQVYVIYPLVEDSEKLGLKSATQMHNRLSREVFPQVPIALLHGRMDAGEKDQILADFKAGRYRMLVSTTVIEVGIDVPNATLMVIEHPERLGLSQLHQLRGRVGRGALESQCILLCDGAPSRRLQVMAQTEDGFEIAEQDLAFRGAGDLLGTMQSGLPLGGAEGFGFYSQLVEEARSLAEDLQNDDPGLIQPRNAQLGTLAKGRWQSKLDRLSLGY